MKELIVLVAICYAVVKLLKWLAAQGGTTSSTVSTSSGSNMLRTVEIPKDANGAVSRFAWLCSLTRSELKNIGGLRDDHFSSASIRLSFGESDTDTRACFRFCFDYSLHGLYRAKGYELGTGLTIEDSDCVEYSSNSITGLKSWGSMTSGYDEVAAQRLLELVALTFTNECPDAYVHMKSVSADALFISFKFR